MPIVNLGSSPRVYMGGVAYNVLRVVRAGQVLVDYAGGATVPVNTAPPAFSGTPRVGQALTIFDGTWSGTTPMTTARRVQYSADGSTGWTTTSNPTTASYTPAAAREGQYLRVGVQMTNSAGTSAWVNSAAVGPVAAAQTASGLLSGTTWPSQSQAQPTDLIPSNARLFASSAPYIATVPSGLTFGSTGAIFDGTTTAATVFDITLPTALVTGRRYGLLFGIPERTTGNVSVALMPGNISPEGGSLTAARNFTRAFTATQAHTSVRITIGAGANLRMNYISLVDMTTLLAKKWRVVFIFDAQSNIVGAESSDVDWSIDRPELRAVYIPGVANSPFGSTFDANGVGKPLIVQDPLQHSTTNAGGGPMGSFVKRMTDSLRDDEILVLIATGWAGQGRLNSGYWNRDGSDFRAWTNMLTQLRGTLAQAPTGSTTAGALQCGHEADVSVNSATLLPAAVSRDIADLRAEFGNFPVVMMEIGTQNVSANQIAQQDAMESLAGSLSLCRYVRRPAGATFRPDGIHYDQPTNRIRGAAAAEAMLEMSYGSTRPSTGTAPSFTTAASISPTSGAVGTVFTISNGTATGSPSPTITRTLTQAGVDVTSQISGGQFTSTAAGPLALTVTASNGVSPAATSTASATISASGGGAIANTLTNPPVSARLGGVVGSYTERAQRPFVNAFKTAQGWQNDADSSMGFAQLLAAGHIDVNGRILSIPPLPSGAPAWASPGILTYALQGYAPESGADGTWRLRWSGRGTVTLNGPASQTVITGNDGVAETNEIQFSYTTGESSMVAIVARTVASGSQLSNFRLAHQNDWADDTAGKIFRQQYLDEHRNYRTLLFDEWVGILQPGDETAGTGPGLMIKSWASRPVPADEMFYRFVPYEWMIELCNLVGADCWVTMPTAATDDHFTQAAQLFYNNLASNRVAYASYSIKFWDASGTVQYHYIARQGRIAFKTTAAPTNQEYLSYYGMRSTQMAQAWRAVWGASNPRLKTVIEVHGDWIGQGPDVLEAPMWRDRAGNANYPDLPAYVAPSSVMNYLTIHSKVDGGMAYGGNPNQIATWRTTLSQTEAFNRMRDQLIDSRYFNNSQPQQDQRDLLNYRDNISHYKGVATSYGLGICCYEMGNHLNGVGGAAANGAFVAAFSASSQMGEVYAANWSQLKEFGFDGPICISMAVSWPNNDQAYGFQRWLGDHNAAWQAMETINLANDGPAGRGATAFIGTAEVAS